jgi:hypothetical protein
MEVYMTFVKENVILSAIIHFAILGTFGEILSKWVVNKSVKYPFAFFMTIKKMVIWALLGVAIKYTFVGFAGNAGHNDGFVNALMNHNFLPKVGHDSFLFAFFVSAFMNLQFGPFLVIVHRVLDNLAAGESNWKGINKGLYCLLWFWIPAHTVTFLMPTDLRILMAAVWSLALGILLGYFNRK